MAEKKNEFYHVDEASLVSLGQITVSLAARMVESGLREEISTAVEQVFLKEMIRADGTTQNSSLAEDIMSAQATLFTIDRLAKDEFYEAHNDDLSLAALINSLQKMAQAYPTFEQDLLPHPFITMVEEILGEDNTKPVMH